MSRSKDVKIKVAEVLYSIENKTTIYQVRETGKDLPIQIN